MTVRTASSILKAVLEFTIRPLAFLLLLTLAVSNPAWCAGWMPTPEARKACCTKDGHCPMERSEAGTPTVVTQAQADSCCAASEDHDSAPSPAATGFVATLAVLDTPVAALVPDGASRRANELSTAPLPPARVPKHLLLSVFLV